MKRLDQKTKCWEIDFEKIYINKREWDLFYLWTLTIRKLYSFKKRRWIVAVTKRPRVTYIYKSYYFVFRATNRANRSSALQSQNGVTCRNLSNSKTIIENSSNAQSITNEREINKNEEFFSKEYKVSVSISHPNLNKDDLMDQYKCRMRYSIH